MVELSDCYFCGTVADVLEQYPVVPPETNPPDERQRRVVVCGTCREKLDRVIEPVVAHLETKTAWGTESERSAEGDDVDDGTDHDSEVVSDAASASTDGVDGRSEADPEGEGTGTDSRRKADVADGTGETSPDPAEETGGIGDLDDGVELPDETRQILQLLGNRDFPVDREEIVAIAANAYGVTFEETEAVLDALGERGRLAEEDGTLHRRE